MSRNRCEEVMRRYLMEVVIERNLTVIEEIADPNMRDYTQKEPGREGLVRHVTGFHALLPKVEIEINEIIADEDKVAGIWTWRGEVAFEFLGIPVGREVKAQVVSLFRLSEGLIIDYWLSVSAKTTSEPMYQGSLTNIAK
jgi:predicted ester cyclase